MVIGHQTRQGLDQIPQKYP